MTAEALLALVRVNLALAAAILVVLALRTPARRWCGAHVAYALWLLPPIAAVGALAPPLAATDPAAMDAARDAGLAWLAAPGRATALIGIWAAGAAVSAGLAAWRHARFVASARRGRAGPAIVGVIAPRLVMPADFAERFGEPARQLVRAHELAHVDRHDARAAALVALAGWVCWFNPLVHVARPAFRFDQELACDATVIQRQPAARRRYAETLLRVQAGAAPVFGCGWAGAPALETRLRALARGQPAQTRRDLGLAALVALSLAMLAGAWAAQPAAIPAPVVANITAVDLAAPDPAVTRWVYRSLPGGQRLGAGKRTAAPQRKL